MRPSSSPSIPLSSVSRSPSVSFFDKYEGIFQCDGGCITEDEDVSIYQYHQSRSDETEDEQQNNSNQITTTEALHLNLSSSSYLRRARRKHHESPPPVVTTVMYKHQASYDNDEDTFDIDEQQRIQSQTKIAQTEEAANNEYFHNRIQQLQELIHNSNDQSQITQMPLPILSSPDTTTQQQQQQRHQQQQQCQCPSPTPIIKPNNTYTTPKPKSKSKPVQYEMCTVVMPSSFRLKGQHNEGSWKHTTDSESTQSTQSMSESDGDDLSSLESHCGGRPEEEDTPVSILRRKVVKFGTNADTTTKTKANDSNRGRRVVRFEKDTQFPDPKERSSPRRKHVPRMSQRQKKEYQRNHYDPPTTVHQRRRQVDLSSLLIQLFVQHRPL